MKEETLIQETKEEIKYLKLSELSQKAIDDIAEVFSKFSQGI